LTDTVFTGGFELVTALSIAGAAVGLVLYQYKMMTAKHKEVIDTIIAGHVEGNKILSESQKQLENVVVQQQLSIWHLTEVLAAHDMTVYGMNPSIPEDWEERAPIVSKKYAGYCDAISNVKEEIRIMNARIK